MVDWQVCRTASEKTVGVTVLESEVKSDAMWHVPPLLDGHKFCLLFSGLQLVLLL